MPKYAKNFSSYSRFSFTSSSILSLQSIFSHSIYLFLFLCINFHTVPKNFSFLFNLFLFYLSPLPFYSQSSSNAFLCSHSSSTLLPSSPLEHSLPHVEQITLLRPFFPNVRLIGHDSNKETILRDQIRL